MREMEERIQEKRGRDLLGEEPRHRLEIESERFFLVPDGGREPVEQWIDTRDEHGIGLDRPPEHDAIDTREEFPPRGEIVDPTVQDEEELGEPLLQAKDSLPAERWNGTVTPGIETPEPGVAGVDDHRRGPGLGEEIDEAIETLLARIVIESETTFHTHAPTRRDERPDDGREPFGLRHEAGSELSPLDTRAGTARIQVDALVGDDGEGGFRRAAGLVGIGRPELEEERRLSPIVAELSLRSPLEDRPRDDHFGHETSTTAEDPEEATKGVMGDAHHGGDDEAEIAPGVRGSVRRTSAERSGVDVRGGHAGPARRSRA